MKLLISSRRFQPPFMGGADVFAGRLGRALRDLGHEVAYLAINDGPGKDIEVVEDRHDSFRIWRLKLDVAQRPEESFAHAYDPQMGALVRDILLAERPELFVIMNFYLLSFAAVKAAKELGTPVVHIATDFVPVCRRFTLIQWDGRTCRSGESLKSCAACLVSRGASGRLAARALGVLPEETLKGLAQRGQPGFLEPYWRQVRLMAGRRAVLPPLREAVDLVLAPARYTAEAFVANGFRPEQVHFLPFGVEPDHPLSRVEHTPAEHMRFLFVGRLQPYKGPDLLIRAFNILADPRGATLTLYGGSDGYEEYAQELQRLAGGNPRIRFAGTVPPAALAAVFAEADYFVLPSTWHENSPLILLDALQSKTPVISADIGGVAGILEHEVNGLIFPMGDVEALRRTMQRAIERPEDVRRLRTGVKLPAIQDYARELLALGTKPRSSEIPKPRSSSGDSSPHG